MGRSSSTNFAVVHVEGLMSSLENQRLLSAQNSDDTSGSESFGSCAMPDDSDGDVHVETVTFRSRCKRALDYCKKLPFLVVLTLVCNAIGNGFTYSISYLIIPVSAACSPLWSHSATVYGSSAVSAGWIVGSIMGSFVVRKHLRLCYVISIILYSSSIGLAGVMVLTCHQTALAGEILYIAVLGLYGISTMFVYFTNFEFGMLSMPNWPGFCGGIHGMSLSIGALLLPQIIILLRETFSDFHINPGTIFFCLAILKIISSAPWLPVVSPDCQHKALINEGTHTVRNQDIRKMHVLRSCTMWLMAIGSFAAYVPPLALLAVQEPLLHALWSENHAPISLLSALLMMSFLIGRVLCLFYSDNMGMKRVWITALLAQIVFLGCLGFIMTQRNDSSMKYVGMAVLSAYYVIFPAFKSTMAGFGHEMFGSQYRLLAVSVMSVMSGVAGLVGPVAIDTIYNHFNSYSWFFFGSAGLSLIGGVAILAVQPQHES